MQATCRTISPLLKYHRQYIYSRTLSSSVTAETSSKNNRHMLHKDERAQIYSKSVNYFNQSSNTFAKHYSNIKMMRSLYHTSTQCFSDPNKDPELSILLKEIANDFKEPNLKDVDEDSEYLDSDSDVSLETKLKVNSDMNEAMRGSAARVDIDAELLRYDYEEFDMFTEEEESVELKDHVISDTRGETGVFDIEELVELLQSENATDICVIAIPPEIKFVDHMVIVTGRSIRHLRAMGFYVKKLYKLKRGKGDPASCKIEGDNSDWLAMDLGNIVLHLFLSETRELYDLETLWTVGPEYDTLSRDEQDVPDFSWVDAFAEDFKQFDTSKEDNTIESMENMKGWHKT